jgi:hypothetical protein
LSYVIVQGQRTREQEFCQLKRLAFISVD